MGKGFISGKKASKKVQAGEESPLENKALSEDMAYNIQSLMSLLHSSFDIKTRNFNVFCCNTRGSLIFIENLVKEEIIVEHVIKPLMSCPAALKDKPAGKCDIQMIQDAMMSAAVVNEIETIRDAISGILSGDTVLFIQGCKKGLLINTKSYIGRQIGEPLLEATVKGPQEAFGEQMKDNMGLIRKRLRDPNLVFEMHAAGIRTKENIVIVYIKDIADAEIVNKVRMKIAEIEMDDHVSPDLAVKAINDNPHTIFQTAQITERPDKVVSNLLEGRVAIILEGSPKLVMVPVTLPMLLQSPDDYYENWIINSSFRLIRYLALLISAIFPALYIAITSFHPGLLPTSLTLTIAGSRTGVPFPAIIEAMIMEVTLEFLQEAGIRLPRVVGQTVSIVGGLVIGQAAVQAGIVSPIMVIVVSTTAIASFMLPDYSLGLATRIVRIPFMFLATTFGAFGISMGLLFILGYLSSLESFGVRYLEPIAPFSWDRWKDTLIRTPQKHQKGRLQFMTPGKDKGKGQGKGKGNKPNEG